MPTTRPRHTITETEDVAAALEQAADRWPEDADSRSRLLLRLIEVGRQSLDAQRAERRRQREDAIRRTAGAFTGMYPEGYLQALRDEWPE